MGEGGRRGIYSREGVEMTWTAVLVPNARNVSHFSEVPTLIYRQLSNYSNYVHSGSPQRLLVPGSPLHLYLC